jgi:hypothetical protein
MNTLADVTANASSEAPQLSLRQLRNRALAERERARLALVNEITAEMERTGRRLNSLERPLLDEYAQLVITARALRKQGRIGELTEVIRLMARIGANLGVDRKTARRNGAEPPSPASYAQLGEEDE